MTDTAHRVPQAVDVPATDGHACALCGQATTARRIDWAFIGDEVRRGAMSLEHGLLHTLLRLMFQPGRLLRDYLDGRRAGYVKPLWLLLTTAATVALLNRYMPGMGTFHEFGAQAQIAAGTDEAANLVARHYQQASEWVVAHLALVTLLLLPLEAAALQLAFWRVRGLNYPEWLTITAYLTAQTFVVWSVGILVRTVVPHAETWSMLLAMLYLLASLVSTFDDRARWRTALRSAVGLGAYLFATTVVFSVAVALVLRMTAGS